MFLVLCGIWQIPGDTQKSGLVIIDAFAKTHGMAKQKFRPQGLVGFSGTKAYRVYVEILKKRRNAVDFLRRHHD
jgi:hypothetical protein